VKAETTPAKLQPSSQTSAAGSQWEADELQKKREELDKRAAELDRREQDMQRNVQFQGGNYLYFYTVFHKKNPPLGFLFYLSQMLLNDSENWNKYSSFK